MIGRRLPRGYTEQLALETTGSSFMDSGVDWSVHPRIVLDCICTGAGLMFGERATTKKQYFGGTSNHWYFGTKMVDAAETSAYTGSRVTIDFSDTALIINGTTIATYDATAVAGAAHNLYLFGAKSNTSGQTNGYAAQGSRIYSAKIYKTIDGTETLVFDGIPCVRDNDSAVGFYDLIGNSFIGVTAGEIIAIKIPAGAFPIDEFWLDGEADSNTASAHGIKLQKEIEFDGAEPHVETVTVAGRNGDILLFDGAYENVTGKASCYCLAHDVASVITTVNQWLMANTGYRRLETYHDPDHYRMARVTKGAQFFPRLNKINAFEIEFDCMPQRWLKSGAIPIPVYPVGTEIPAGTYAIHSGDTLYNPSAFVAKPRIQMTTTASEGWVNILFGTDADYRFAINLGYVTAGAVIVIDCETRTITANGQHIDYLVAGYYESLFLGYATPVSYAGNVTSVSITPRWWTL